jgi:PBP1b-binding outer membrane lipoprotein LpoB
MNNSTITILILAMLSTAGCASTGESYTDEGANHSEVVDKTSATATVDLAETSGELPEIAPYDEPEVPALETPATE